MNKTDRKSQYPIMPLILNRWSPRAMTGEKISHDELMSLFEAARWAPSSYNNQPWRFVYAEKDSPDFQTLFNLLIDFNKSWCDKAAVLVVIIGAKNFEKTGKPSITYALDTGFAWANLCLEGNYRGFVVHGMQGFDYKKAKNELNIPDDCEVLAMIAIGKPASKENLSKELQEKEFPSDRKPVAEFAFNGKFQR